MKNLLLVAGFVLLGLTSNAQEKAKDKGFEGVWWAAGQVSFNSTETGSAKTTSNMILPVVGTFISPSVSVGIGIGNINSKTETGSLTTAESNTFVIKPLMRKYWNISGNLFFFGQAALPVLIGKEDVADSEYTSFGLELAPGFDYIINKWLTVETSFTIFNVSSTTTTPAIGEKTSTFNFNANPMNSVSDRSVGNLQVGVKFLF